MLSHNFLFFYLETNQHFDAVACDYYLVDNLENVTRRADCFEEPIACGIMFRRDHLLSIGCYDESFLCHEEQELRIRFEKKYRIAHLDIPLYRYRRHETNMTNDSSKMNSHYQKLVAKHGLKALN